MSDDTTILNNDPRIENFVTQFKRIEGELALLKEEQKNLFDDYKQHFKPRVLREAIRTVRVRAKLGDDVAQLDNLIEKLDGKFGG
jgi:uncharacterized protein (UPF0335 family)